MMIFVVAVAGVSFAERRKKLRWMNHKRKVNDRSSCESGGLLTTIGDSLLLSEPSFQVSLGS
jgi:hypothetical protein